MAENYTVKDLYNTLSDLIKTGKGDMIVVVSRDEEGNGFSPLGGISTDLGFNKSEGEVWDMTDADAPKDELVPCLVIWP